MNLPKSQIPESANLCTQATTLEDGTDRLSRHVGKKNKTPTCYALASQKREDLIYTAAEALNHSNLFLSRPTLWAIGLSTFAYDIRNWCMFFTVWACLRGYTVAWSTQNASRKRNEFAKNSDSRTCKFVSTSNYLQTTKIKLFLPSILAWDLYHQLHHTT